MSRLRYNSSMENVGYDPVVYLVRHATPDWDRLVGLVYHLPPGPVLTRKGLEEAGRVSVFLKEAGVARLYSSPLERCVQTARMIAVLTKQPLNITEQLMEVQPKEANTVLVSRAWSVFEMAVTESIKYGPVVLTTHGGVIKCLLRCLGMDPLILTFHTIFDHGNPAPPAGVWQVSGGVAGNKWKLKLVYR